ncbi:hypothetical protein KJ365_05260 [Glaciecola sp. XM2]|jgi:hypothetical protein|uniref:hypothetical protein n=1 Tax=Glaciecola sp. XM2 TaxID=1914931 RepID=UPI001BDDCF2F|nr:hypothetical protein [Glaciecola sp. XM2]MBT1450281.1 hypothetical protein [Glaciecola sp. XM2]
MHNMLKSLIYSAIAVSMLASCATIQPTTHNPKVESVDVTIYRSGELQGSLTDAYVGWDGKYFAKLAKSEYTVLKVPVGMREFTVRAHADLANELTVMLKSESPLCMMLQVNPDNIVGLNWFVPSYQLKQVACLSEQQLSSYKKI